MELPVHPHAAHMHFQHDLGKPWEYFLGETPRVVEDMSPARRLSMCRARCFSMSRARSLQ